MRNMEEFYYYFMAAVFTVFCSNLPGGSFSEGRAVSRQDGRIRSLPWSVWNEVRSDFLQHRSGRNLFQSRANRISKREMPEGIFFDSRPTVPGIPNADNSSSQNPILPPYPSETPLKNLKNIVIIPVETETEVTKNDKILSLPSNDHRPTNSNKDRGNLGTSPGGTSNLTVIDLKPGSPTPNLPKNGDTGLENDRRYLGTHIAPNSEPVTNNKPGSSTSNGQTGLDNDRRYVGTNIAPNSEPMINNKPGTAASNSGTRPDNDRRNLGTPNNPNDRKSMEHKKDQQYRPHIAPNSDSSKPMEHKKDAQYRPHIAPNGVEHKKDQQYQPHIAPNGDSSKTMEHERDAQYRPHIAPNGDSSKPMEHKKDQQYQPHIAPNSDSSKPMEHKKDAQYRPPIAPNGDSSKPMEHKKDAQYRPHIAPNGDSSKPMEHKKEAQYRPLDTFLERRPNEDRSRDRNIQIHPKFVPAYPPIETDRNRPGKIRSNAIRDDLRARDIVKNVHPAYRRDNKRRCPRGHAIRTRPQEGNRHTCTRRH